MEPANPRKSPTDADKGPRGLVLHYPAWATVGQTAHPRTVSLARQSRWRDPVARKSSALRLSPDKSVFTRYVLHWFRPLISRPDQHQGQD
jgi:hypothetical protein